MSTLSSGCGTNRVRSPFGKSMEESFEVCRKKILNSITAIQCACNRGSCPKEAQVAVSHGSQASGIPVRLTLDFQTYCLIKLTSACRHTVEPLHI